MVSMHSLRNGGRLVAMTTGNRRISLEVIFRRELNYARIGDRTGDLPKGGAGRGLNDSRIRISQARVRIAELGGVRQVEELHTKLERVRFSYRKAAIDRHVEVVLPRTAHDTYPAVAKVLVCKVRAERRFRRARKSIGIQISVDDAGVE